MEVIISKTNGLSLEEHIKSVYESGVQFNNKLKLGLDNNVIKWFSILHDLGKANPIWLEQFKTKDFKYRHEIGSIAFIGIVPPEYREIVKMVTLSHHNPIDNDDKSFIEKFEISDFDLYMDVHFGNISEWGVRVKNFLYEQYKISCEIPTYDDCARIVEQTISEYKKTQNGVSLYRGVCMMGDHFGSCYDTEYERNANFDKLFHIPDVSVFDTKDKNYPLSLIQKDYTKKHTLTVCSTGSGKTNFAVRMCSGRLYYMLPYQASINAMYKRLCNAFKEYNYAIGLKHGAKASVDFMDFYEKQLSDFYGLPITVATPFQIFSICLRLKGYESIINDIKGCDIILDELHTYSGISKSAVYALIRVLKSLGCHIHIITATMPTAMENAILEILGYEDTQITKLDSDSLKQYNRHILHLKDDFDLDDIVRRYQRGEKVMIVRNQKGLSQETYDALSEYIPKCDLLLLHSKFRRVDRNGLESTLYEFNDRVGGCVFIGTQVVEVSIDVSFDCLYTDCADICSLIQRFGRINRHRASTNIYKDVYVVKSHKEVIHHKASTKSKGWFMPYEECVVDRTYEVLEKIDGKIIDENELQTLIDFVHPKDDVMEMEMFNPFNNDGTWKQKMYSNCINKSIGNALEFEQYIGVVSSDFDAYSKNNDRRMLEVPLSKYDVKKLTRDDRYDNVYIIPDKQYDMTLGFIS